MFKLTAALGRSSLRVNHSLVLADDLPWPLVHFPLEDPVADYPLIFKLTHEIRCNDYAVRVVSSGRALMTFEDGEWWCHGVEPGGLTEHGPDPASAFAAFKVAYRHILQDLSADSKGLDGLAAAVEKFVADKDHVEEKRWNHARAAIRAGKDVEEPFNALRREVGEFKAGASVGRLRQIEAGEEMVALAEAA